MHSVAWVKSKIAPKVKFAESLQPSLQHAKSDCLNEVSRGDGIKIVSDLFKELDGATGILKDKFSQCSTDSNIQQLLPSRGMVARALRKVHTKVIHRLSSEQKLANTWLSQFTVDMPYEVFSCISKEILVRTNFGHEFNETNTQLYKIDDFRKARYLFRRMDIDGAEVDRDTILKKPLSIEMEKCEVIVSGEKPLELRFHKKNEVLTVKFNYGYWIKSGVPRN